MFGLNSVVAQQANWTVDATYSGLSWEEIVNKLEQTYGLRFYYDEAAIGLLKPPVISVQQPLDQWLRQWLIPQAMAVIYDTSGNVFISAQPPLDPEVATDIYPVIRSAESQENSPTKDSPTGDFLETELEYLAKEVVIGNKKEGLGKQNATISGYLRNVETGEAIIGGALLLEETGSGTASDENGFYTLTAKKGKYTLVINYLNSKEQRLKLNVLSSGSRDFALEPVSFTLNDVVITSERYNAVENSKMGFERLTTKSIKEIPLVLGERDIIKIATLLPGIQSVGEGTAGFNVRGSPADQNLFYIDGMPVYNTSHLFGFFSAFNSDAISEFSLSKGNIPSQYGGRLASIFDITALEGDKEEYKLRGGISPITGRLLFEGPIQKGKSSVMVGIRSTYSNWLLKQIKNQDFKNTKVFFGDAMAKLSFTLNPNNRVYAFGYYSQDAINFAGKTKYDVENMGGSLLWNHFFNKKHNFELSLVHSKFSLDVENRELDIEAYRQNNVLEHTEAKFNLNIRPRDSYTIMMGANAILYQLNRGEFQPAGESSLVRYYNLGTEKGLESGVYLSGEWEPTYGLTLTGGLRLNRYSYLGPQSITQYQEGQPKTVNSIVDTLQFGNNEFITNHTNLDFRAGAKYSFGPKSSIKASYNKLHQYIFLLSNTIAVAPADKWKLTDYHIDPMEGDQYSLGYYRKIFDNQLEVSLETYYKEVKNLIQYKDGADLLVNEAPERDVLGGDLKAYGFEVMVKKPEGQFNGWVNYTYSRSKVLAEDELTGEQINFGQSYSANYDKPHSVNLVANYKFVRRFSLSANVVYSTGRPVTYPSTVYFQDDIQLINFSTRNEYRLPDYFRVDLSMKLEGNLKAKKLLHGSWVFSVYNLTGRKNAYNVYFQTGKASLKGYKVSIFAVPVFSISYNFKFGNYAN
ncbi:MAG: TonB-dependent receptor [Saprospiraceae bacterium]|nr:MAG: TonB-dependent receptor [Saprospiraceae bacterium]